MAHQDYANDLRNIADQVEGLEESYDNLVAELQETDEELDRANDKIGELEKYIAWAESYYPEMVNQYAAICAVQG
jgi:peptidoglycan hydrolase CwlO-like protein